MILLHFPFRLIKFQSRLERTVYYVTDHICNFTNTPNTWIVSIMLKRVVLSFIEKIFPAKCKDFL